MKTSTLHRFQPSQHLSGPQAARKQLCPCTTTTELHQAPEHLKILLLHEQSAGKLHQVLSAAPWAEWRGCRVGAAQWSEYVFLNDYVNRKPPGLETIQIYPADCILYTIYCFLKETVALYAYFSTSIHGKSSSSEFWMTIFFSQYNRLFFLFILRVLSIMNFESSEFFAPSCSAVNF